MPISRKDYKEFIKRQVNTPIYPNIADPEAFSEKKTEDYFRNFPDQLAPEIDDLEVPAEDPTQLLPEQQQEANIFKNVSNQYKQQQLDTNVGTPQQIKTLEAKPASRNLAADKPIKSSSVDSEETPSLLPSDSEMANAQQNANLSALINRLGKAGELIGSSIAGAKPIAQQTFDEQINAANVPVEQLLQARKEQENQLKRYTEKDLADPTSSISQLTRDMAKKALGKDFGPQVSAAQLKAAGIDVDKMLNAYNLSQDRELRRQELSSRKEDDKDMRYTAKFNDALNKLSSKKNEAQQYMDNAFAQAQEATKNPAAAALLARSLTKAIEGAGARVSDKDAQTALRAGGVKEEVIAWLNKGATGTIPKFQANDISKLLTSMKNIHDVKFKELEDQMIYRQSKLMKKPEEKIREESFIPAPKQMDTSEVERMTADGRVAIFDKASKKFLRYK